MHDAPVQSVLFAIGLGVAAAGFIGLVFLVNKVLSPRNPTSEKLEPYECGMEQAGRPRVPVRVRFGTVALIFVLFDAESALLFAVSTRLRSNVTGAVEVAAFVVFLGIGLLYAWRKGALSWRS